MGNLPGIGLEKHGTRGKEHLVLRMPVQGGVVRKMRSTWIGNKLAVSDEESERQQLDISA